ncbi:MAG TPA: tRNA (adenosine(37)-N6)-threonylcarbamoyltransferase complex dimerization subunit type 1 TsaB [Salinimicrobium sp.]|nr:tRNA (adenosine(37)-N6)-threonylcarbamoyltransferase complex dimerization subunit type 1 TsaB [Salinimicrobium sp.]
MVNILCIETATTNCSVAIFQDGKLLDTREDNNNGYSHAEKLHVFIDELLSENKISPKNLNAVAVSSGPGSYTGLRIGVSTAKGICYSLGIPLISIPTLVSLAEKIRDPQGFIIPMLDARRMEVYAAGFDAHKKEIFRTRSEILTGSSYQEFLETGKVYFIGSGTSKFDEICDHPNAIFIHNESPSSKEMGTNAFLKFENADFEDVAYFEPFYLKDFLLG